MTDRDRTAADWLRAGVDPDAIPCGFDCGGIWDGTTPDATPACVACRAAVGELLVAGIAVLMRDLEADLHAEPRAELAMVVDEKTDQPVSQTASRTASRRAA